MMLAPLSKGPHMPLSPQQVLNGLARLVDGAEALDGSLETRLDEAVESAKAIFAVDGAGMLLVREGGKLWEVGATSPAGRALEETQRDLGVGPGIVSTTDRVVVAVEDLATDVRWPALSDALAGVAVRGVLSAPIWIRDAPAGSLNLFDGSPRTWTSREERGLATYAGVLTSLLTIALDTQERGRVIDELREALGTYAGEHARHE